MSDELTSLQVDAMQAKYALCEEIGVHGCGGCPLDKIRREKNMSCDDVCRGFPMLVVEAAANRKNDAEQPKAGPQEIQPNWEAIAKRLQRENKRLTVELNAERKHSTQLEKDLQEAREEVDKKDKLKERVVGQRDTYLNVLSMMLDKEE